jgi:gas vesicle protein
VAEVTQELRHDIERIRDDLDTTLDTLGERVSPRKIARRRKDAVRARVTRIRTAVMGSAEGTGTAVAGQARHVAGSMQEGASRGAEQIREAPQTIQQQTRGNPLAAGLIAFGAGMVVATLFPPTEAEQRAADAVQERVEPLKDQAVEAGREMKDHLQESARESAQQVKDTATEAAQEVKGQTQSSAQGATEQAKSSAEEVKEGAGSGKSRRP